MPETPTWTFEEAMNFVHANVHRFSREQRIKMIAECYPGFFALMQFEMEEEKRRAK